MHHFSAEITSQTLACLRRLLAVILTTATLAAGAIAVDATFDPANAAADTPDGSAPDNSPGDNGAPGNLPVDQALSSPITYVWKLVKSVITIENIVCAVFTTYGGAKAYAIGKGAKVFKGTKSVWKLVKKRVPKPGTGPAGAAAAGGAWVVKEVWELVVEDYWNGCKNLVREIISYDYVKVLAGYPEGCYSWNGWCSN